MEETTTTEETDDRRTQPWLVLAFVLLVLLVVWLLWNYWGGRDDDLVSDGRAGVETAVVPDVVGLPESEASERLKDAGFEADADSVFDESAQTGTVVKQDPAAGLEAEVGSTVVIGVASAFGLDGAEGTGDEENPLVPDVVGDMESSAIGAIESAGFYVTVRYRDFEPYQKDVVFEQSPEGGTRAPYGSQVVILMSTGPQPPANATVPDTLGLTQAEAVRRISAAGFSPQVVPRPQPSSAGRVFDQFPPGGDVKPVGSEVHIAVGTE